MAYIVPTALPTSCSSCPFSHLRWSCPWWSKDTEKVGTKAYICQAHPERKLIVMDIDDETTKAEWCPLKPIPEKQTIHCMDTTHHRFAKDGFNHCIDVMLGQNKKRKGGEQ